MKLRELLIGATITLVVTIVGGFIVWLGTEYLYKISGETVTYSVDYTNSFQSGTAFVGTSTITVRNTGSDSASDINAEINFNEGIDASDNNIETSSGSLILVKLQPTSSRRFEMKIPSLNPNEYVKVSFLLKGSTSDFEPFINVRTSKTLGKREDINSNKTEEMPIFAFFSLGAAVAALGSLISAKRIYNRSRRDFSTNEDHNNSAFISLHKKQIKLARYILDEGRKKSGFSVYSLANYALLIGIEGDEEGSKQLFDGSIWWSQGDHEMAVTLFNRASLRFHFGDIEHGKEDLQKSINLSPKYVKLFCELSDYIGAVRTTEASINDMVNSIVAPRISTWRRFIP